MMAAYFRRALALAYFVPYFLWELILANFRVALDVVARERQVRPGIVAVPTRAQTRTEITLLANLVSLTPGTLVLDISSDHKTLYLHAMHLDEIEQFPEFEARFLRIFR